tara:strand:+ start:995 stop:1897 length:903 start_codon:yes stop_codon:yes gene_type:complete
MARETQSNPLDAYFLRKDTFFSDENPLFIEQTALLEEHVSNLLFDKKNLLTVTTIPKQTITTKLAKRFKESYNVGQVSKSVQDKLLKTYNGKNISIVEELIGRWFTKSLYKQSTNLTLNKKIPFKANFFSCVIALPVCLVEDRESFLEEVLRVLETNGLFAFGMLGPGTLHNFYAELVKLGNAVNYEVPIDKHDLGDLLIKTGFDSPILTSNNIVLKYSDSQWAFNELRKFLYLTPTFKKNRVLGKRDFKEQVLECLEKCRDLSGNITLDIEMVTGHAWQGNKKPKAMVNEGLSPIFFDK